MKKKIKSQSNGYPELSDRPIYFSGFEDAIIGMGCRCGQDNIVVYDLEKVIELIQKDGGLSYEEAMEHFEFNVRGGWYGETTPIFVSKTEEAIDEQL